jgi:glutathione S-transferase
MSELILHSFRRCPFAIRVRMALEEKGLKFTVIEEDLGNPSSELLRLNPSGQVPVLVHEGRGIPESAVITEYLEKTYPTPALMPPTQEGRAEVRAWTDWCAGTLKPDLDAFKYDWEGLLPEVQEQLRARLMVCLTQLENQLTGHSFMLDEMFSLADIHLFPFFRQLSNARPKEPEYLPFPPGVRAWMERINSRPCFVRAMAKVHPRSY